jgi:hypothetical protein
MIEYLTATHLQIIASLRSANIAIIVNTHKVCSTNKFDGYAISPKHKLNETGRNEIAICMNTIKRNYADWNHEVNRTIAHESVHLAQMCKSRDGYIRPLGFRKDIEAEAFAIQDNPKEVLRIVRKYCL